ncbi:DHH family phosphoesterase [bacterium]|nr:DHH family phosphoesterase [bacterium]
MNISFSANPINKSQALYLQKKLSKANFVDIICHNSSDEDTVACARALKWLLIKLNKESRIITDNIDTFELKKDSKGLIDLSKESLPTTKPDTVVCVDFSSFTRVKEDVKKYINSAKTILCIDHHCDGDISDNIREINNCLTPEEIENLSPVDFYVDSSAKSCSSIVLKLFQTLKINIPNKIKELLFCGMTDDLRKNEYLKYNETLTPVLTEKMMNDKITLNIYKELENEILPKRKNDIIKHLNVLASLNQDEKKFQERLFKDMKTTKNGKFAYVIIPPNDEQWHKLGGDNAKTSGIMGNFRTTVLDKNKYIDSIAVFYQDKNGYRISIHSKNNNVINLFNHIKETLNPDLQAGGHEDRGGGTILSFDQDVCIDWAKKIIAGAETFFL